MSDEESDATNEISDGDTTADDDDGAADRILRFFYGDICIFVLKDVPTARHARAPSRSTVDTNGRTDKTKNSTRRRVVSSRS